MVLRILKSNQPVNFIIFPLIGIAIWLKSVLSPKVYPYFLSENENILFLPIYKMLQNMPVLQVVTAFVLVILIGFLIQRINSSYSFIKTRTMLPAPLIILIISGFTAMQTLHPVYFAALFLLLAIHRFFSIFDKTKPFSALFDTGLLIGIGSLFYFNLILIMPAFLLGIIILRNDFDWHDFAVCFFGFVLPIIFALSFSIVQEYFLEQFKILELCITTPNNHFKSNIPLHIFLGFLIILTFLGSIRIIQQYDTKKVSARKYFTFFFLIFIFCLLAFIFVPATSQEMMVLMAIPVTFLVSNLLVFMKSRFWSELIFTLILGMVIYMQIAAI